jgi:carbamoyl-phosphate synthase small subunit
VSTPAVLALEDGTVFRGVSVGAKGNTTGEVVFNTAMTGYQEILTDPSYCRQIVTLTYPHVGNTGTTPEDLESGAVYAAGLVIRDLPLLHSNWRSTESLSSFLLRCKVVAIADIDTRKLTRLLREKGAQSGCIMTGDHIDETAAVRAAKKFPGLKGMDLAKAVSTKKIYQWNDGLIWKSSSKPPRPQSRLHVIAYDFGIKRNILRILAEHGCRMTVVPAQTPADQVFAMNPDGIFLSNGPGDPEPCDYAIEAIARFLETDLPVFGICLGHQLLGLASGAMDETTLPATLRATHRSLFDGSLQGLARTDRPAFSFQGHPEASPGPHDLRLLFEHFMYLMVKRMQANSRGRNPVKQKSAES